jgi:predicted ArsR family transcriptional regulator
MGLDRMTPSTRTEILTLLKRNGGHSVAELASELKLAPITVRQHVTRLERDGLLVADHRAGSSGRPHYVYKLTAKAHAAAFPRRTDRLIELLVREVGVLQGQELVGLSAQEKTLLVLDRVAQRFAHEYAPLLGDWQLPERVAFVTEVMHAEGGLAEWEKTAAGYEIRDFNCLFHRLLNQDGSEVCEWHQYFLSYTLAADVRAAPCSDTVGQCCRFIVSEPPAAVSANRPGMESILAQ